MPVVNRFAEMHEQIAGWRRDLHAHPEILFEVHRTAGVVAEKLRAFGVDEVVTGLGRTGVVALIRGRGTGSGRVVGLRADMDALPIHETTGLAHASRTSGAMHACGHDGHTAMLLGAAKYLAETRNFDGTVAVIFQPAEEGGAGGREMVEDGMMDRFGIEEVYGMHNMPGLPVGPVRHPDRAHDGRGRRVHRDCHGLWRARRAPAHDGGPGCDRRADRHRAAVHRRAQRRSGRVRRDHGDQAPGR